VSADDPIEFGPFISGIDLSRVDAQVVDGHLVVRGVLTTWNSSDVDNLYEILLDTDLNPLTGELVSNGPGSFLGADYRVEVFSVDLIAPVYLARLFHPDGTVTVHEAWVAVDLSAFAGDPDPGSFTVTIPIPFLVEAGPQAQLFATTGQFQGASRLDIAPTLPLSVGLNPAGVLQFSSSNYSVAENGGNATITVVADGRQRRHGHGPLRDRGQLGHAGRRLHRGHPDAHLRAGRNQPDRPHFHHRRYDDRTERDGEPDAERPGRRRGPGHARHSRADDQRL
jgi:hypothetical protein